MRYRRELPFGAELLAVGGTRFRLWAPGSEQVGVDIVEGPGAGSTHVMQRAPNGWHEVLAAEAGAGTRYHYRIADGLRVPDPASRSNPLGVHGPSEVVDALAYRWEQATWRGRPWHTAALYELHIGTFTPEGTFASAALRLPELADLGVSAIELMPVAAFSGARGWGYDGVLPFAPHAAYGSPNELKHFIDTAHSLGLMVLLDVVYNHFGPDGNYLGAYCPAFFDPRHETPWGAAINLSADGSADVRRFFIENALYWIEEYRFDGLRLDAVHTLRDDSLRHLIADIAHALDAGPRRERFVHLVLENDANTASWLARTEAGAPAIATAQWNDDLHHAAHVVATFDTDGYYADYATDPVALLGRALAEGFVYQGQPSPLRGGALRGEPSAQLPSQAFIAFLQNHDQIGNRALGERLDALAPASRVEALLACVLLAPQVPMLFMGEEFAAATPFLYFCDFEGELAAAVANGRRAEFAHFGPFRDARARERIPDPNALATFVQSKLPWPERSTPRGRQRLALVARLLALRHEHLEPLLPLQRRGGTSTSSGDSIVVDWHVGAGMRWTLRANFGREPVMFDAAAGEREVYRNAAVAPAGGAISVACDGVQVVVRREAAA
jgi:maltooligosyltrehalose trehalohydrolase